MKRAVVGLLVVLFLSSTLVAPAAAQSRQEFGGLTVREGETFRDVTVYGGDVVVEGTIDGDLEVYSGNVVIAESGTVTGRIRAFGGDVTIEGEVRSNSLSYGGRVEVTETGSVGATFGAVANEVVIAGELSRDTIVVGSVTLENSARVGGSVYYTGEVDQRDGAQVNGIVQSTRDLDLSPTINIPWYLITIFGFLTNLVLGLILLLAAPETTGRIADRMVGSPLESAAAAIVTIVGVPLVAGVLAVTVVGIPIALALLAVFGITLWLGGLYARIAIGAFLLQFTEVDDWWAPLVVGLVLVTILVSIPVAGPLLNAVLTAFGLGALALGGVEWYATGRALAGLNAELNSTFF